jgi:parallel beta-helix repeat protein
MVSKIEDRLQKRWNATGQGPDVQARLDLIKKTLKAREEVKQIERRDLSSKLIQSEKDRAHLERKRKEATVEITNAYEDALPEEAFTSVPKRPNGDEIVSKEDVEAEEISNQLVDVFQRQKMITPDMRLKDLKSEHPANAVREKANAMLRSSDLKMAVAMYDEVLNQFNNNSNTKTTTQNRTNEADDGGEQCVNYQAVELSEEDLIVVVTLCNRSKAKLRDEDFLGALEDALKATKLAPTWSKARFRAAEAYTALSAWTLAVSSLRVGEDLTKNERGSSSQPFKDFLDIVAIKAAKHGSTAGFDGRVIYVRSGGEDAWLGKEAPSNAEFDVTDADGVPLHAERWGKEDGLMAEARRKAEIDRKTVIHARSLRQAIDIASDGDKILLLRGIHNGSGHTVDVTKRVWIKGEGCLKEATIDMRANSPTFRITRSSVVSNVDFDFSGFAESLRVSQVEKGNPTNKNAFECLIETCSFTCTGCDGIVCTDKSKATFRNCNVTGKNNAIRLSRSAEVELIDCRIHGAEQAGIKINDTAQCTIRNSVIENCGEEGIVCMQDSECFVHQTIIRDNKAPAIDISNNARCLITDAQITNNIGGVWSWDTSSTTMCKTFIDGGQSHTLVFDNYASATFSDTVILGVVHASEKCWKGIKGPNCTIAETVSDVASQWPTEDGPFKFSPNAFTRKM